MTVQKKLDKKYHFGNIKNRLTELNRKIQIRIEIYYSTSLKGNCVCYET